MRILCVNPWIHDFSAYDFWSQPLGLLSIAAWLRQMGHHVYFLDCLDPFHPGMRQQPLIPPPKRKPSGEGKYARERIPKPASLKSFPRHYHRYGITPKLLDDALASLPTPDLVLVTAMMTYWYPGVFETIAHLRMAFPGRPTVLGGNYVTLCPDHARLSGADLCLTGPAEAILPGLLKDLGGETMLSLPEDDQLDAYPYPAFDLLPHPVQIPIMTSRGCPYCCSYCASRLTAGPFRQRNPEKVIGEILYWRRRLGIHHFSFYDDALLVQPGEMAIPMLKGLIATGLPLSFHCPNGLHLREINPEISKLMIQAGFRTLRFGFETADHEWQRDTGGKVTNDEFLQAVRYLLEAGYQDRDIGVYLLCGLPGQAAKEVEQSIRFVQSAGARPIIAEYSPIPGTALWHQALLTSAYPLAEDPLFHNNTLLPCGHSRLTYEDYQRLKQLCRQR
ncbi:MAG: B12-binding domain-containing radical SAM protein [Syntrophaceae bacterium]|nr:B12-binding domain-containing radical SAM protein [Syntrophaceae bacterium]